MSEEKTLTKVITGVKVGKSGTTNGKDWTRYVISTQDGKKLATFTKEVAKAAKELIGKKADLLCEVRQYEDDMGDTKTSLDLKSVSASSGTQSVPNVSYKDNGRSFYYAYAKDLYVALIASGGVKDLPEAKVIADYGNQLWRESMIEYPSDRSKENIADLDEPDLGSDIPF